MITQIFSMREHQFFPLFVGLMENIGSRKGNKMKIKNITCLFFSLIFLSACIPEREIPYDLTRLPQSYRSHFSSAMAWWNNQEDDTFVSDDSDSSSYAIIDSLTYYDAFHQNMGSYSIITFNSAISWNYSYFECAAKHELGHHLGYSHNSSQSIMQSYLTEAVCQENE